MPAPRVNAVSYLQRLCECAGLTPIVNLARSYALECGVSEPGTIERLQLVAARGRIDDETYQGVIEAFRLMWRIRLEHHAACVLEGRAADDTSAALEPLTRAELREAFRFVRRAQRSLRRHHGLRGRDRSEK